MLTLTRETNSADSNTININTASEHNQVLQTNPFSLRDRFEQPQGTIALSAIDALVRILIEQRKADRQAKLNTAAYVSGYPGSPLAGYDLALNKQAKLLGEYNIHHQPAVNEDLGVSNVLGSQIANLLPDAKYDGVLGLWYAKSPGIDRSADALRHANAAGVGRLGGTIALVGDDPLAKSSSLPNSSENLMYDLAMPILSPGTIEEILSLGRYAFELSRFSGAWSGFKVSTNLADSFATVSLDALQQLVIHKPQVNVNGQVWQHKQVTNFMPPYNMDIEEEQHNRLTAAQLFIKENNLNKVVVNPSQAWLGIVAAGKTYYDLREALSLMNLSAEDLEHYGIRIYHLQALHPLDKEDVRSFADGLEEIVIVEEKRSFVERFFKDLLYSVTNAPVVVGKQDMQGQALVPFQHELNADIIQKVLIKRLSRKIPREVMSEGVERLELIERNLHMPFDLNMLDSKRGPYFCSGCPHNISTALPEGSIGGGGIGCHALALHMDRDTSGIVQMGGEGSQWVGAERFTNTKHYFQNLGDGTFFHSGYLAVRQAIAANANMTYKILYNGTVAMTGGQDAAGVMDVPSITHALKAEGITDMIVVSSEPAALQGKLAEGVKLWERDRLDEAQNELKNIEGVTVLIYDQACANELRRMRKRGKIEEPKQRVYINEAVCEGCGDCGEKSNCLSVLPVETDFGRKTQIHQASCNKDYSCLEGDCPAFVTFIPDEAALKARQQEIMQSYFIQDAQPEPQHKKDAADIYFVGIGGTGVVSMNRILALAALYDGKYSQALDQTGLSQKGGEVVSHLRIATSPVLNSNFIGERQADAYIAFDLLSGASEQNLQHAAPDKTVAVVSDNQLATGAMVRNKDIAFPATDMFKRKIDTSTSSEDNLYLNATNIAESIFGSHMPSNILMIGVAYQKGLIPLSSEAIEQAIEENGVAVEQNKQAFRIGRQIGLEPAYLSNIESKRKGALASPVNSASTNQKTQTLLNNTAATGELKRILDSRVSELVAYQNANYANRYLSLVTKVQQQEQTLGLSSTAFSEAVAKYYFKLLAYKDEYEVARLYLNDNFKDAIQENFGDGVNMKYHLHPPFLRAMGLKKKLKLPTSFDLAYKVLARFKFLRGTAFNPFNDKVRQAEQKLIKDYEVLVEELLPKLTAHNQQELAELVSLPDQVRGYETIKLKNIDKYYSLLNKKRQALNL